MCPECQGLGIKSVVDESAWIIDLGPEGGHNGGEIVFEGTPTQLTDASTHTAHALREYLQDAQP